MALNAYCCVLGLLFWTSVTSCWGPRTLGSHLKIERRQASHEEFCAHRRASHRFIWKPNRKYGFANLNSACTRLKSDDLIRSPLTAQG
ncbi:hypothetical protein B0H21DRAFT_235796 [Amylocystis lapponica]|nr:hypothetical protein B0H21DRAFT_235796 [Amylocystis lapponica]